LEVVGGRRKRRKGGKLLQSWNVSSEFLLSTWGGKKECRLRCRGERMGVGGWVVGPQWKGEFSNRGD